MQMLEIYSNTAFLLYQTGQRDKVIPAWVRARQAVEKKAREHPKDTAFLVVLAQVDNNLGAIQFDLGQDDEARKCYQRALETLAKIPGAAGKDRSKLTASLYFNLGLLAFNAKRAEEAIAYYEMSLALHRDEKVFRPDAPENLAAIGQQLMSIGD